MAVDKSEVRVRRMFGEIARRYDFLNHLLSLNVDRYWRRKAVREVPPQPEGSILDLCSGTGDLAIAYVRKSAPAVRVIGADFCHEMLQVGVRKGEAAGYNGRLTFVEADAQRLPFPDDHFQIVTVAFGLRNVTDTDLGLQEMARVCRPGGTVAVLEFSMPRGPLFGPVYRWYFRRVLPWVGQKIMRNKFEAYNYLPASVSEFPDGEALAERMRAVGLSNVRYLPLTFGIATLYMGTK